MILVKFYVSVREKVLCPILVDRQNSYLVNNNHLSQKQMSKYNFEGINNIDLI